MSERKPLEQRLQERVDAVRDVEESMWQLVGDMKYPLDANGNVLDMNHLPDVPHTLAHHLIKCGWRRDETKRLIKPRPVRNPGYYADLVAWVPIDADDTPIENPAPPDVEMWSMKPTVNDVFEERS